MAKLKKEDIEKIRKVINSDRFEENTEYITVLSNDVFITIGDKAGIMTCFAAGLQQLICNDQFDKEDVEMIFKELSFDKEELKDRVNKELGKLIDEFIDGLKSLKEQNNENKEEK